MNSCDTVATINNTYEFNNIKFNVIIDTDNNPWFKGKEVSKYLDFVDTAQAIRKHVPDKYKKIREKIRVVVVTPLSENKKNTIYINEYGLYKLVFRSKKPEAEKLTDWMLNQLVTQEDFGPLECIEEYILACDNPTQAIISIGATRYTEYGETTFLKTGDEVIIIVYNKEEISHENVVESVKNKSYDKKTMSVIAQKVI